MLFSAVGPAQSGTYNGLEIPDYQIVETIGDIEIRQYAPYTEAQITRSGSRSIAAGSGFRPLANYIFGGNQSGTKMAMTAPVTQEKAGSAWTVSFVLPSDVTPDAAPVPNAEEIRILERPATEMAVIQFSGRWTQSRLARFEKTLRAQMTSAGLKPVGAPVYMFYNDPFTPPWTRRNEIGLRIAGG